MEENGWEGAQRKAQMLEAEYGYRVLSVEHCLINQAGSLSTPYAKNYGKKEMGYKITVDNRKLTEDPIRY